MDVLKGFMWLVAWVLELMLWLFKWLVKIVFLLFFIFVVKKLWRFFTRGSRTPSGHEIVKYDDGRQFIKLEGSKGAKMRLVPDTPELRERLMENKRQKSIWRHFRRT